MGGGTGGANQAGLPAQGIMTGISANDPQQQFLNQMSGIPAGQGLQMSSNPTVNSGNFSRYVGKAGIMANALQQAFPGLGQQQPQQRAMPVNFNIPAQSYIPPPQIVNPFGQ